MMVMTAKFNLKKILMLLAAVSAVILSLILLTEGTGSKKTAAPDMSHNPQRVQFLKDLGWDPKEEPLEAGPVKMPQQTSPVYERYNALQKSQGYDLSPYAGKKVLRYVYELQQDNPGRSPMLATLLIYKDQIIGGDITDPAAGGKIGGFRKKQAMPQVESLPTIPPQTTAPAEQTLPPEAAH